LARVSAARRLPYSLGRALGGLNWPAHNCGGKVSEIHRLLNSDGWYLIVTRGNHRQFKHPTKSGRVTVPGKPSDELAPGTLNSIRKQAGFKK
jgi:predicted RNA binding protein YcfA (HicA-like mRNA interferase family)